LRRFSSPIATDHFDMHKPGPSRFALAAALLALATALAGCGGGWVGDYIPQAMGGLPKDAPPRAGQPGYEEWQEKVRGNAPKNPVKPSTAAQESSQSAPR
jgi:hypothetical protein